MTTIQRILCLGMLAASLLCSGCSGGTALSGDELLSPAPVADEDLTSGIAFDGSTGNDQDNTSSVRN